MGPWAQILPAGHKHFDPKSNHQDRMQQPTEHLTGIYLVPSPERQASAEPWNTDCTALVAVAELSSRLESFVVSQQAHRLATKLNGKPGSSGPVFKAFKSDSKPCSQLQSFEVGFEYFRGFKCMLTPIQTPPTAPNKPKFFRSQIHTLAFSPTKPKTLQSHQNSHIFQNNFNPKPKYGNEKPTGISETVSESNIRLYPVYRSIIRRSFQNRYIGRLYDVRKSF